MKERAKQQQTWWQKRKQHPVRLAIIMGAGGLVTALIVVIVLGYWFNWPWVGVNGAYSKITTTSSTRGITTAKELLLTKTLWDWLQLLIIPLMLAVGGFWLNQIQKSREERATAQRDKTERDITLDKQRQDLLQTYLDRMSELLLKEKLRSSKVDAEVRNVARVRTITVLTQLDARRLSYVFSFLHEAGLMSTTANDNVVSLKMADLHAVNWGQADLSGANLSGTILKGVDLREANLSGANLSAADLSGANLSEAFLFVADLSGANLSEADLSGANLSEADLRDARLFHANLSGVHLSEANLSEADLEGANLMGTNLSGADLSYANLKDAVGVTVEELEKQAKSLKGATMPDGSKHP